MQTKSVKLINLEAKMCWNLLKVPFKREMEAYKDSTVCQTAEEMETWKKNILYSFPLNSPYK